MKLRLNYIVTLLLLFSSITLMAQRPSMEEIKEDLHSKRVAYVTTRLTFTPEEAEKFWLVYNEFDYKRIDIQMDRFNLERNIMRNFVSLTDDEIISFIKDITNNKLEEEQLNVKYYERFLKILPPKKVLSLFQVEKEFLTFLNNSRGNRNNFNR